MQKRRAGSREGSGGGGRGEEGGHELGEGGLVGSLLLKKDITGLSARCDKLFGYEDGRVVVLVRQVVLDTRKESGLHDSRGEGTGGV